MLKTGFRITKNIFSLIVREGLNKGALFILLILIGRFMGKEALGRYSLAIVISQIFFFGTELGLNTLVIREVARERLRAADFLFNIGILRVFSGLVAMGLIWITALVLGARGEAAIVILLCGLSYFFVNIINLYTSIFRAFERMELELAVSFVKNIVFLPFAAWALFSSHGLIAVFTIFLGSNIMALIVANLIFIRQIGAPPPARPDFVFWKEQLTQTRPLWLSQLFGIAYLRLAPLLLFRLKGEEVVGLYNAGFVVLDGFWIMAGCFVYSVFPMISRLGAIEARAQYLKGFKVILLAFSISAAVVILMSKNLVLLFYGEKFIEITPLFKLFALISVVVALDMHTSLTIIARGKQSILPFINGIGLAANLLLNIFFILRVGYLGSAYALAASECLVFILMITALRGFLWRF